MLHDGPRVCLRVVLPVAVWAAVAHSSCAALHPRRPLLDRDGALVPREQQEDSDACWFEQPSTPFLFQAAHASFRSKDWSSAVQFGSVALSQLPTDQADDQLALVRLVSGALTNLGAALYEAGDKAAARAQFEHAVSVRPNWAHTRVLLGTVMRELGTDLYETGYSPVHNRQLVARAEEQLRIAASVLMPSDSSWVSLPLTLHHN